MLNIHEMLLQGLTGTTFLPADDKVVFEKVADTCVEILRRLGL